jgi:hypothetical protein
MHEAHPRKTYSLEHGVQRWVKAQLCLEWANAACLALSERLLHLRSASLSEWAIKSLEHQAGAARLARQGVDCKEARVRPGRIPVPMLFYYHHHRDLATFQQIRQRQFNSTIFPTDSPLRA